MLKVKDLTTGSIVRHLVQLALPIMGTSFIQMAYSFTDMAWLGRLGSREVAAVGIISVFLWIANAMTYLTKTGSEVTIGQSIGRGEVELARSFASHNTAISILVGSIWAIGYTLLASPLINLYAPERAVSDLALEYMRIATLGLPVVFLTSTLFGVYNATGNSRVPFLILGLGLVCNMILDPLLIFGVNLGVKGAAWATVLSQWIVMIAFVLRLRIKDKLLANFSLFPNKIAWSEVKQIFRIGIPPALLNVFFALVTIYMGRLVSTVGGHVGIAVLTTGGQLEALTWNTAQGVTTALSTIVAQNYAARKYERVWATFRVALSFTMGLGFLGMLYFILGGESLFRLIVPDRETFKEGATYLRISGYSQVFMMIEITIQGLLYGMGKSHLPAGVSIFGNILRIPTAIAFIALGLGLSSIWWAISLSSILKGLVAVIIIVYLYSKHENK